MTSDLFQGTVPYYIRYRIPYPAPLLTQIVEDCKPSGKGKMLDLGCGPGELALRLSPEFQEVIALDSDQEMLSAARKQAHAQSIKNIHWINGKAEEFEADADSFELVTIGAAFHWMERQKLARHIRNWLLPGQPLVILGYTSIWSGTADWLSVVRNVVKKWLGEKRRAGSGAYIDPAQPHEFVLLEAGYTLEEINYRQTQEWTLDKLIGNLYSTSFASPAVLGENRPAFENDLRKELLKYDSSGIYTEQMTFYALIARPTID